MTAAITTTPTYHVCCGWNDYRAAMAALPKTCWHGGMGLYHAALEDAIATVYHCHNLAHLAHGDPDMLYDDGVESTPPFGNSWYVIGVELAAEFYAAQQAKYRLNNTSFPVETVLATTFKRAEFMLLGDSYFGEIDWKCYECGRHSKVGFELDGLLCHNLLFCSTACVYTWQARLLQSPFLQPLLDRPDEPLGLEELTGRTCRFRRQPMVTPRNWQHYITGQPSAIDLLEYAAKTNYPQWRLDQLAARRAAESGSQLDQLEFESN